MAYFIPRGTPIEIQQGDRVRASISGSDFCFLEPVVERADEMIFTDGKSYFLVAKALVIGDYIDNPPNPSAGLERAGLERTSLEGISPTSADQVSSF